MTTGDQKQGKAQRPLVGPLEYQLPFYQAGPEAEPAPRWAVQTDLLPLRTGSAEVPRGQLRGQGQRQRHTDGQGHIQGAPAQVLSLRHTEGPRTGLSGTGDANGKEGARRGGLTKQRRRMGRRKG